ncbi:MAG: hypothetical protein DRJ98_07575 [Thermoprotei archaeon]|nr:MAG: hypothetical protein DRJ98_07575 [Thermoprotei archaeon]
MTERGRRVLEEVFMKIVPVLDVKEGVAVRAFKGKREEYVPLTTWYCSSPDPVEVARSLRDVYGLDEVYLADLDAIEEGKPNVDLYRRLRGLGIKVMVDAGVKHLEDALSLSRHVDWVVAATETLKSFDELKRMVSKLGLDKVVASIDIKDGRLLAKNLDLSSPLEAARRVKNAGLDKALLICLDDVGTLRGVDLKLTREVIEATGLKLYVGGGVRGLEDLIKLSRVGVQGALVGTAIHRGLLRPEGLKRIGHLAGN